MLTARPVTDVASAARSGPAGHAILCHGGPLAEVEDVRDVLGRTTGVAGFFGASSMERLPTETAIRDTVRRFKDLRPEVVGEPGFEPGTSRI